MHHGGASTGGVEGAALSAMSSGRARDVGRAILSAARAGDGAGDEDITVDGEGHGEVPLGPLPTARRTIADGTASYSPVLSENPDRR